MQYVHDILATFYNFVNRIVLYPCWKTPQHHSKLKIYGKKKKMFFQVAAKLLNIGIFNYYALNMLAFFYYF